MRIVAAALLMVAAVGAARGEDLYVSVPLSALHLSGGKLPETTGGGAPPAEVYPRIVLESGAEAYVYPTDATMEANALRNAPLMHYVTNAHATMRLPAAGAVSGRLLFPDGELDHLSEVKFTLPVEEMPKDGGAKAKEEFLRAKQLYFYTLVESGASGGAYFRHEENAAREGLGERALQLAHFNFGVRTEGEDEYGIVSGGGRWRRICSWIGGWRCGGRTRRRWIYRRWRGSRCGSLTGVRW